MERAPQFYGKYRGVMTDNLDPLGLCRIRTKVPSVYGNTEPPWALPCLPFADKNIAIKYIPSVGSLVWIEFENGDSNSPIWTGCFYSQP
jgi:uncharacterized protein involved in type VI secretion and phage assembly